MQEARKRVLFADDDADDRMLFEETYGGRTDITLLPSVVNGQEVIDQLNEANVPELPDLIILDQNMPLVNGKQALEFIKGDPRFSHIPVCICSTYADNRLVQDCLKLGAYQVASKPVTEKEYYDMLDNFLTVFHPEKKF